MPEMSENYLGVPPSLCLATSGMGSDGDLTVLAETEDASRNSSLESRELFLNPRPYSENR